MDKKCDVDELSKTIVAAFNEYSDAVAEECQDAVKIVAKNCRAEIKAKSPVLTGDYAKGWKTKTTGKSATSIHITIHNTEYRLIHLLENGHASRNGGRPIEGKPHVFPAEARANEDLVNRIKVIVKK